MAKDYAGLAKTILELIGGEDNVSHLEHCSIIGLFHAAYNII